MPARLLTVAAAAVLVLPGAAPASATARQLSPLPPAGTEITSEIIAQRTPVRLRTGLVTVDFKGSVTQRVETNPQEPDKSVLLRTLSFRVTGTLPYIYDRGRQVGGVITLEQQTDGDSEPQSVLKQTPHGPTPYEYTLVLGFMATIVPWDHPQTAEPLLLVPNKPAELVGQIARYTPRGERFDLTERVDLVPPNEPDVIIATIEQFPAHLGSSARAAGFPGVEQLSVQVLDRIPVSPVFTQGLEFVDGTLVQSSGLVGKSSVRRIDPADGKVLVDQPVPGVFGEGIAVTDRAAFQLTWKDRLVIERDRSSLRELRRFPLTGAQEGWGACWNGNEVLTSDGTDRIAVRDPVTFAVVRHIDVRDDLGPVQFINELDCTRPDTTWANVWPTDRLIRVDVSGRVTGEADLTEIRRATGLAGSSNATNGIATVAGTDIAYVTGKNWPHIVRVRIGQS
nr:glutaminyl-peptide cyclotransferase [Kibdelosporangium sp. MJ126-NF4]CEL22867.1 glutamine cyclotransferase [Kibdelosporangium sp. MJ126-NF4]CTQ90007.1 glutamine cyclotransferase [Kibdelosporangium sp. MJ126-NF4]